jgi:hypothetical protein
VLVSVAGNKKQNKKQSILTLCHSNNGSDYNGIDTQKLKLTCDELLHQKNVIGEEICLKMNFIFF